MSDDTRERSNDAARDASAPPNGTDGNQNMFQSDGHLDAEMVSAWLDTPDDFSEESRTAIEAHMASCAECRLVATELTAIVRALKVRPLVESARSFALTARQAGLEATPTLPTSRQTEEMVRPRERGLPRATRPPVESYEQARWLERQMSRLRWATTIAVMLFVFFVSVDVLGNIDTSGDDDDMATDMAPAAEMVQGAAAAPTATTASSSALMATAEPDDDARNGDQPTPASVPLEDAAGGSQPEATAASAAAPEPTAALGAADAETADETSPAESAAAEATPTDEELTTTLAPDNTAPASQTEVTTGELMTVSDNDSEQVSRESDTLHLIELALAITIAWLLVALIALPRLRRPVG